MRQNDCFVNKWQLPFYEKFSKNIPKQTTFDSMISLESEEITAMFKFLSKPQPYLNIRLGLTIKWLCTTTTETQCQQYLSCYWPDFDETLKVGSWEHLEQFATVTVTFVQSTFVLAAFVHIRISGYCPMLIKLFGPSYLGALFFLDYFFSSPNFLWPKYILDKICCTLFIARFFHQNLLYPKVL